MFIDEPGDLEAFKLHPDTKPDEAPGKHVRRYCPAPGVMTARLLVWKEQYEDLADPTSGLPLFSEHSQGVMKRTLEAILKWQYSGELLLLWRQPVMMPPLCHMYIRLPKAGLPTRLQMHENYIGCSLDSSRDQVALMVPLRG